MKYHFKEFFSTVLVLMRQPVLTLLRIPALKDYIEPLFFLLRWLLPIALLFRYLLHNDSGIDLPLQYGYYWLLLFFFFYLAFSEYKFHILQNKVDATPHDWRVFTSWFSAADIAFITLFYILAKTPRSDIPYLYVIPIVWSIMFMPLRNNLFPILCVSIFFAIGSVIVIYLSSGSINLSELLLVLMPKVVFLPIIVLYLLWIHVKLKLSENIINALFDKSPDGISFIGQKVANQNDTLIDMQILKLNAAQQRLTPNAKSGGGSCRTEFNTYSKLPDTPCPWCPASPVLDGHAKLHRSLTSTFFRLSPDIAEEVSFSDASASFCSDEKDKVIAAVKFVKDVTPQVFSAFLASDIFLLDDEDDVLKKTTEHFRKMFKADFAKLAKFNKETGRLSIIAQSTREHPDGSIVSGMPTSISPRSITILESCPSEVDIIQRGTDQDDDNCLFWNDYCIPESPNPSIGEIANNFDLVGGLITPIKLNKVLWGVMFVNRNRHDTPKFTQFDVLYAQLSAQVTAVALERLQMLKEKDASIKQFQTTTKNTSHLQLLCADFLRIDSYDKIIALALIGATCRLGLRYSRAIFLKYDNDHLKFQFGIGPITSEDARSFWDSDKIEKITEYYSTDNWYEMILSNNLTRVGKDHHRMNINDLSNSVISQSLKDRHTFKGEVTDSFLKTTLSISLRIEGEFVVAPIYFGSIVHGIVVADKKYLADESISEEEREQLLFLTAFTGACSNSSKMSQQMRNTPLQLLTSLHDLLKKKYQEKEIDVFQLANLVEKLAVARGFSEDEVKNARIAALAVNFVHLCFSDNIIFGTDKISQENKYHIDIRKHPEMAEKLLRMLGGHRDSAESAFQHHILFDGYPDDDNSNLSSLAKLIAISESYLALINPKQYKGTLAKTSAAAIAELQKVVSEEDKDLIKLLAGIVEDSIE